MTNTTQCCWSCPYSSEADPRTRFPSTHKTSPDSDSCASIQEFWCPPSFGINSLSTWLCLPFPAAPATSSPNQCSFLWRPWLSRSELSTLSFCPCIVVWCIGLLSWLSPWTFAASTFRRWFPLEPAPFPFFLMAVLSLNWKPSMSLSMSVRSWGCAKMKFRWFRGLSSSTLCRTEHKRWVGNSESNTGWLFHTCKACLSPHCTGWDWW